MDLEWVAYVFLGTDAQRNGSFYPNTPGKGHTKVAIGHTTKGSFTAASSVIQAAVPWRVEDQRQE